MKKLQLKIVSQEKELLTKEVDSVSIPTTTGEITVLPDHLPLFSQVQAGELIYREASQVSSVVVNNGFVNVAPGNQVTVMVDSGVLARDISMQKAQEAVRRAQETIIKTRDQRELMLAEASLKQALLEMKVAQKTKKAQV